MSGLVGVLRFDRRPVDRRGLEGMAGSMPHRGRINVGLWCGGRIGLGHLGSGLTPRAHVHGPVVLDDDVVLVGDVRLDAREDVLRGLSEGRVKAGPGSSDLEIFAAAYLLWGEACIERLIGDFAVAIWDARRDVLVCFRDHLGVRPLYYHHAPGRYLVFGSEVKAVWAWPEVRRKPCEAMVACYLGAVHDEDRLTFGEGVLRLPPGMRLTSAASHEAAVTRYWSVHDVPDRDPPAGEDPSEEFRARFLAAVSDRIDGIANVGLHLSGGVDSSSVTCVAHHVADAEQALHTYSGIFTEGPRCDERAYIDLVLDGRRLHAHEVHDRELDPGAALVPELERQDGPFWSPFLLVYRRLYQQAESDSVQVVLDGIDGDAVAFQAYEWLVEAFLRGRWGTLARELRHASGRLDTTPSRVFRRHVARRLMPRWVLRAMGRQAGATVLPDLVSPELARRTSIDDRRGRYSTVGSMDLLGVSRQHRWRVSRGIMASTMASMDLSAGPSRLQARHPFYDLRVVSYLLSLPGGWKFRKGATRYPLRAGLEGIVPDAVRWRADKAAQVSYFVRCVAVEAQQALRGGSADILGDWVEPTRVATLVERYSDTRRPEDAAVLWRVHAVATWMEGMMMK